MTSYPEILQEFYDGEVLGEAIYSGLLAAAGSERERRVWGVLLQLETETKCWLRAPMTAAGVSLVESDASRERAGRYVASMTRLDWPAQMKTLADLIDDQLVPRFEGFAEAARARAAGDEEAVCRHMVVHEQVQADLARRELAGEPLERVLAAVEGQLRYPLPAVPTPATAG